MQRVDWNYWKLSYWTIFFIYDKNYSQFLKTKLSTIIRCTVGNTRLNVIYASF